MKKKKKKTPPKKKGRGEGGKMLSRTGIIDDFESFNPPKSLAGNCLKCNLKTIISFVHCVPIIGY